MNQCGLLILGHGTPSAEGTRSFMEIVELIRSIAGDTPVAAGFMEFASPTIAEGAAELEKRGAQCVAAVPVFLSGAGHTAEDIPPAIEDLKKKFSGMQFRLAPHVGSHPKVAELSALRYQEAIADLAEVPASATLVVIAAHGSPEPEAMQELERFALARQKLTPATRIVPCFSQLGVPLLKDVLPKLAQSISEKPSSPAPLPKVEGRMRIVVQPHFLLKGRLVDAIAQTTADAAAQHPEIDWIVTAPLGCHRLLAEAVRELGIKGE
jgi:sirohydrochlorin ferrochelatase